MKKILFFFGGCTLYATYLTFGLTFIMAFISPGYEVTIKINDYSEAFIEMFLLIISIPICTYTFIEFLKQLAIPKTQQRKQ